MSLEPPHGVMQDPNLSPNTKRWISELYKEVSKFKVINGEVKSATGTELDFVPPPNTKAVWVTFVNFSLSGSNDILIQLGTGGVPVTTGYDGCQFSIGGAAISSQLITDGFGLEGGNASRLLNGTVAIHLHDEANNIWCASGLVGRADSAGGAGTGSSIALSGSMDIVRVTRDGANTLDNGSVSTQYGF